jgi:hypothetical protein
MSKRFVKISISAVILLILTVATVITYNHGVLAKSQPNKNTSAEMMARYSPPNQKNTATAVRQSRLNQQNIVAEAANVLNVLPIDIIKDMEKGKTLVQVAKDKGLTETEFNKKLTDFDTKIVDKAVKDGTITKEHGDAIKAGRTDRIKNGMKEKAMKAHTAMDMGN